MPRRRSLDALDSFVSSPCLPMDTTPALQTIVLGRQLVDTPWLVAPQLVGANDPRSSIFQLSPGATNCGCHMRFETSFGYYDDGLVEGSCCRSGQVRINRPLGGQLRLDPREDSGEMSIKASILTPMQG